MLGTYASCKSALASHVAVLIIEMFSKICFLYDMKQRHSLRRCSKVLSSSSQNVNNFPFHSRENFTLNVVEIILTCN